MSAAKTKYALTDKKPGKTKAFFICLGIAIFLWLVHSLNRVYTYTFKIPDEFRNIPVNKRPVFQLPDYLSVDVRASGMKLALILMKPSGRKFEIDFNSLKTSNREQNYVLSSSGLDFNKRFRFETQVRNISPDTLYFSEKTGFQKTVPVKVPLMVKCKEGYGYKKPVLQPAYVTIWGDTSLIEKIDTLYTQTLSYSELGKTLHNQLKIIKPNAEVHTTTSDIAVTLEVARLIQETVSIPVTNSKAMSNEQVRLFPSRVRVSFTSLQNNFKVADTALFSALVNTDKVNPKTRKCAVYLNNKPNHVTVLEIDPKEVEILILKHR